jgi:hypothetical protein
MIVTLDGRRVEPHLTPDATLEALVGQIRNEIGERLVVSVSLDGRVLNDADLQAIMSTPIAATAQLDFESSAPHDLVVAVLRGLAISLAEAQDELPSIADTLTSADRSVAIPRISGIVSLWQTSNRALAQCSDLIGEDLTLCESGGRAVREHILELIGTLTTLRQALEAQDLVTLSDLVRYELPALAERWQQITEDLAHHVEARAAASAPRP